MWIVGREKYHGCEALSEFSFTVLRSPFPPPARDVVIVRCLQDEVLDGRKASFKRTVDILARRQRTRCRSRLMRNILRGSEASQVV